MKKTTSIKWVSSIVLLLFLSTQCLKVKAQTTESFLGFLNATFGVKGGINLSNLYVQNVSDENAKIGFQVGLFAKAPIAEHFSLQPELLYSLKGSHLEYNNTFAKGKVNYNLHYIELPVMAVFNIAKNFNVHAGPYIAYLAGVDVKNKTTTETGSYDFEKEINRDNFHKFDYGVAGGIGADGEKVGFGIRYNYGLKEIGKERQVFGQSYNFPKAKNSVVQAYLTLGF
jgi:hypothetical protein